MKDNEKPPLPSAAGGSEQPADPPALRALLERGDVEGFNRSRPRTRLDLSGIDLAGKDLGGVDLSFVEMDRAVLRGCDLSAARFDGASLQRADLGGAALAGARFRQECNLRYADLSGALAQEADFQTADLTRADLSRSHLTAALFAHAQLFYATLVEASAERADFQEAILAGALLGGGVFRNANFGRARLFQSAGDDMDFSGANFTGAEAMRAHFAGKTRFTGAFVKGLIHDGFDNREDLLREAIKDREPPPGMFPMRDRPQEDIELLDAIPGSDRRLFDEALHDLNDLVGLREVKAYVTELANVMRMESQRARVRLPDLETNYHFVLSGSPGTGKTTVARILSRLMHAVGFLRKGHLIETHRAGLVAEFVGQTAPKTEHLVDQAMGGMLFIDEAYALSTGGSSDYGAEAIATLLKLMEDRRGKFTVAVAGYTDEMRAFVRSNPGLEDRFTIFIDFADYSPGELTQIFAVMLARARFSVSPEFIGLASALFYLARERAAAESRGFSNGRFVRNTFQKTWSRAANRLAGQPGEKRIKDLSTIEVDDLPFEKILGIPRSRVPLELLRWEPGGGKEEAELGVQDLPLTGAMPELSAASAKRLKAILPDPSGS